MKLRIGYELRYEFPQPTPVIATLNVHFTRVSDLAAPDHLVLVPSVPISGYRVLEHVDHWEVRGAHRILHRG